MTYLSLEEGTFLVKLARATVEEYLKMRKRPRTPERVAKKLLQPCGVFVTINSIKHGEKELRGCIGFPYPTKPLVEATIDAAISSATQDPRFEPLNTNELNSVVFEVSILTPPQPIQVDKPAEYPSKIKVGEDGLIVEKGFFKGLLLPQVPVEWSWDEEEFLCQCCLKAGLPPDCWLMKETKIFKFNAEIFGETQPKGEIIKSSLVSCTK